ncbi:MAG: histidinol dehydrogenase [Coriobacteriales bacterium]|jgi:histidinol dehydrogenase
MIQIIRLEDDEELDLESMERSGVIAEDIMESARAIVADVKARGDEALTEYTARFDQAAVADFRVGDDALEAAVEQIEPAVAEALDAACESIASFHENDVPSSTFKMTDDGSMVGYKVSPIASVGLYIPGGRASYPSTVLMNAVPAKIAGVERIVMVTPPNPDGSIDPSLLYAAYIAGVDEVYCVGGAQAIAALAYGTKTIAPVDKIVGPGNVFVAAAKEIVSGAVGTDLQAGPSEVLILADDTAEPALIAADMIAQAEHDPRACCYLVCVGGEIIEDVVDELEKQTAEAPRREIIEAALDENGLIVECSSFDNALRTVNAIAPEHLEIQADQPMELVGYIRNAGAIFVGPWSPVAIGDYIAGPSHTLPTSGTARFSSPLSTWDFIKRSSVISYSYAALLRDYEAVTEIAESEGFAAHAQSLRARIDLVEGELAALAEVEFEDEDEEPEEEDGAE